MSSFKDKNGDVWLIELTVGTVKRVKNALGADLMGVASRDSRLLESLYEDPELLVNVIYVLCSEQCEARKIDDETFGNLFNGDAIFQATEALVEGLVDFFPKGRQELLKKVVEKLKVAEGLAATKIGQEIDNLDLEKLMDDAIRQNRSGTTFTAPVQS